MPRRVGFVIDHRIPAVRLSCLMRHGPRSLWRGLNSSGPMGLMRFGWVADEVRRHPEWGVQYELYRPFRSYDAVVFLKSFSPECLTLADRLKAQGAAVVFEINVNYFEADGTFYYEGMRPTQSQGENARAMAGLANQVIAASPALEALSRRYNSTACWIPDNVNFSLVPPEAASLTKRGAPLKVMWSGQAQKLFELLSIEEVLREFRERITLCLITSDLAALEAWYPPWKERFHALLREVPHEIIPFRSVEHLLSIYAQPGVVISPRFMDNTYNAGHTEWKLALGMACGRVALGAPLSSYAKVAERSEGRGIHICTTAGDWRVQFEALLGGGFPWKDEEAAARAVVRDYYATSVVAQHHAQTMSRIIMNAGIRA